MWKGIVACLVVLVGGALWWPVPSSAPEAAATAVSSEGQRPVVADGSPRLRPRVPAMGSPGGPLRAEDLVAAAERGDPAAMRDLAELNLRCLMAMGKGPWESARFWQGIDGRAAELVPSEAAYLRAAAQRLHDKCVVLRRDHVGWVQQYRAWMAEAADAGDLTARIRLHRSQMIPHSDPAATSALLDEVLASGDGQAMHDTGMMLMMSGRVLPGYPGQTFGLNDVVALGLLACDNGLACGPGSEVTDGMCLNGHRCSAQELDVQWEEQFEPEQWQQVLQRKAAFEALIEAAGGH